MVLGTFSRSYYLPGLPAWWLSALYDRLVERISQAGGKVLLGTRVEKAVPIDDDHWEIQTSKGTWTADRVISTMATRLTCRLIPALPGEYRPGMTGARHMVRNVSFSPWIVNLQIAIGSIPAIQAILLPVLLSIPITNPLQCMEVGTSSILATIDRWMIRYSRCPKKKSCKSFCPTSKV